MKKKCHHCINSIITNINILEVVEKKAYFFGSSRLFLFKFDIVNTTI